MRPGISTRHARMTRMTLENNEAVDLVAIMIFNAFSSAAMLEKLLQDISRYMCQHLGSELSVYGTSYTRICCLMQDRVL